eukprot:TRINITY_DN25031_c0_g1_i1.p1 TRINITY_DN25031_c0_g1~~TRINITY_DN25031_c0_g1_i1.p1  ORF type:complete len:213 (+),score=42.21 TRINITY_DN25031_c0_g1_i1:57-695(+)
MAAEGLEERNEAVYARLLALSPCGGSILEPIAHGFEDAAFRAELHDWIAARAPAFQYVCEDGSHPLTWTQYHHEYRALFDRQLLQTLTKLDIAGDELNDFCAWLKTEGRSGFCEGDGLGPFLEAVTASEDYEHFLTAMFAETARQAGDTIAVQVPDGLAPGMPFSVAYLGIQYDLVVPDALGPGDTFHVTVTRPPNLSGSIFNLPDSFYGLD